jgi:hypothetical protein
MMSIVAIDNVDRQGKVLCKHRGGWKPPLPE